MQNILGKRVLRDLRAHFLRWSALFGLIVMGTYMIVSLLGAAEIVIREARAHAKDNQVEDGQFTTFLPLKASEEAELTDAGITIERTFHVDFSAEDGGTLRVMKVRRKIDLIECDEGVYPEADGEAVIEKRYAEVHGLHVGDAVRAGRWEFVISGIGTVPDYESPIAKMSDSIVDSQSFGLLFVTDERYDAMRTSGESLEAESCVYAYRLNGAMTDRELKEKIEGFPFDYRDVTDPDFRTYISERMGPAEDIRDLLESPFFSQDEEARDLIKMLDPDVRILTQFIPKNENMRIDTAAADVEINKSTCIFAGIIVFALFAYVIAVFVIHEIEEESEVIGALYALGVTGRDLMRHYTLLPVLVSFLAGIVGTILGMSPAGRVFSALSRETVKRSSGVFTAMMLSMVYVMGGLATIIFVVVMYLMLSVMVENSSYDIALMKIFGYTRGEIRKLYVNGNFYIVAVGTLIVLPLAKVIIDGLYPYFISNVSCAMDLSMPFAVYLVMYGVIIGLYLVITFFLNRKLDHVSMEQVLKNRE